MGFLAKFFIMGQLDLLDTVPYLGHVIKWVLHPFTRECPQSRTVIPIMQSVLPIMVVLPPTRGGM